MKRLGLWACACMLALAPNVPATAAAAGCTFGGPLGTFQVARLVPTSSSALETFTWGVTDSWHPLNDDRNYHVGVAAFIYHPKTATTPSRVIQFGADNVPRTVVEANGTRYVNTPIPAPRYSGSHGGLDARIEGKLGATPFYVVAFGWGRPDGALGPESNGDWRFSFSYGDTPCEKIDVPGEILNYNQTHFRGTQAYAPLVGVGTGLRLDFDVSRSHVFGMSYDYAEGISDLSYSTPTGPMDPTGSPRPLVSKGGRYSATLTYAGVDPLIDFNLLAVDLPPT